MLTIYKYKIAPGVDATKVEVKKGAVPISCGIDANKQPCVWILLDTEEETKIIDFYCLGTGWPLDKVLPKEGALFVGTINQDPYIWHVFMGKEK